MLTTEPLADLDRYGDTDPYSRHHGHRSRLWATALLRAGSRLLDSLAARLALAPPAPAVEHVLEFHADAGAPEGALYVDGQLVGHVLGVTRL
jgi:hypothetical protein